jgi:hypothetical protein
MTALARGLAIEERKKRGGKKKVNDLLHQNKIKYAIVCF